MDVKEFFMGKPSQIQGISPYDPAQLDAMKRLRQTGFDILANPSQGFEPIAQQARTQFQQKTVPMLAERFLGSGQNLASSGLTQQLSQGGAGLEEALAALQAQYGMQNRAQGLSALGMGLSPQFQFFQTPEQQGLVSSLLPLALQAGLGYLTGGGAGSIMSALGGLFNKPSSSSSPTNFGNRLAAMQYGGVEGLYKPSFAQGGQGFTNPLIAGSF
jgi:hypothetical protein